MKDSFFFDGHECNSFCQFTGFLHSNIKLTPIGNEILHWSVQTPTETWRFGFFWILLLMPRKLPVLSTKNKPVDLHIISVIYCQWRLTKDRFKTNYCQHLLSQFFTRFLYRDEILLHFANLHECFKNFIWDFHIFSKICRFQATVIMLNSDILIDWILITKWICEFQTQFSQISNIEQIGMFYLYNLYKAILTYILVKVKSDTTPN